MPYGHLTGLGSGPVPCGPRNGGPVRPLRKRSHRQLESAAVSGPLGLLSWFGYGVSDFLPLGRFLAGGASRHFPQAWSDTPWSFFVPCSSALLCSNLYRNVTHQGVAT